MGARCAESRRRHLPSPARGPPRCVGTTRCRHTADGGPSSRPSELAETTWLGPRRIVARRTVRTAPQPCPRAHQRARTGVRVLRCLHPRAHLRQPTRRRPAPDGRHPALHSRARCRRHPRRPGQSRSAGVRRSCPQLAPWRGCICAPRIPCAPTTAQVTTRTSSTGPHATPVCSCQRRRASAAIGTSTGRRSARRSPTTASATSRRSDVRGRRRRPGAGDPPGCRPSSPPISCTSSPPPWPPKIPRPPLLATRSSTPCRPPSSGTTRPHCARHGQGRRHCPGGRWHSLSGSRRMRSPTLVESSRCRSCGQDRPATRCLSEPPAPCSTDVIAEAKHELIVVSFAAYKVADVVEALRSAADRKRRRSPRARVRC